MALPTQPVKNHAIVVDADVDSRNRLKQAASAVVDFGKIEFANTLHDALNRLSYGDKIDVVFVSGQFDRQQVTTFITQGKEAKSGLDAAFVLTLDAAKKDSAAVAQNVLGGADGLLFEPYSVDQLVDVSRLAARVRKERALEREAAALKFLVKDIMTQVDTLANLKKYGCDVGITIKRFREMCQVLTSLDERSKAMYHDIAAKMFEEAPLPKPLPPKLQYKGASSRVKNRMDKKVATHLQSTTTPPTNEPTKG